MVAYVHTHQFSGESNWVEGIGIHPPPGPWSLRYRKKRGPERVNRNPERGSGLTSDKIQNATYSALVSKTLLKDI